LETVYWFLNVFKVAFGLGFVIFIHELGHFLLAKWNGVKVEKFSIGFGPTLLGFKRGETEYVIAAIPLGGFVKMLGEGPEEEAAKSTDPRAYSNKTVGARMAIISAGVIMNVLLGLGCFVYAYGQGMVEMPARVGAIEAASPAYEAGLQPGDEIVAIDGRGDLSWTSMTLRVILSNQGQKLHFDVRRHGHDGTIGLDIQPRREAGSDRPTIGVRNSNSLMVGLFTPPAGMADPPTFPAASTATVDETRPVDLLVAVGPPGEEPTTLEAPIQYDRLLARYIDKPLVHVFERHEGPIDSPGKVLERFEVTLPPSKFVDFGFRLGMEPINGIQKGSPADRAGFRVGDRIVKVNGSEDFDPMRLPTLCGDSAGKPMRFVVERPSADGSHTDHEIEVTPDDSPAWTEPAGPTESLEIPGLGLCYPVAAHITAVKPDSPAARAGLKPGDVINSITFTPTKTPETTDPKDASKQAPPPRPATIKLDDNTQSWVRAFWMLQMTREETVSVVVNGASTPKELAPVPVDDWYFPSRGLVFLPMIQRLPPQPIASALRRGWDDTIENILQIYGMFRSLAQGRVGPRGVAGPLTIFQVAYDNARTGLTELLHFLGLLSINLAVINFLPIPPLDGGQMLFLLAEKVRGRPLPESALTAGVLVGVVLVIGLMLFVTYQDVFRIIENW
jgi:regulator of sigma E protease